MVDAARQLLREALQDPLNQKMMMLSESGIPLWPPQFVYQQLLAENRSRLDSCGLKVRAARDLVNLPEAIICNRSTTDMSLAKLDLPEFSVRHFAFVGNPSLSCGSCFFQTSLSNACVQAKRVPQEHT